MFGKNKQEVNEVELVEDEAAEVEQNSEQSTIEEREIVDEIKAEEDSEDNVEIVVVKELPVQSIRYSTEEDGTKIKFVTIEEALSEILNS